MAVYDIANNLRVRGPDFIGIDQLKRKNALAERDQAVQEQNAASYRNQLDMAAQARQQQTNDAQLAQYKQQGVAVLGWLDQNDGKPEAAQMLAELAQDPKAQAATRALGIDVARLSIPAYRMAAKAKLGVGPVTPFEQTDEGRKLAAQSANALALEDRRTRNDLSIEAARARYAREAAAAKPEKAPEAPSGYRFNADGSLAAIPGGPADKPKLAPGEAKARREAQAKLPTVEAAMRRIERLAQASENLGNWVADGGPLDGPILSNTKSGQELTQSGASLMPVLTALTRVPGIGAQSDLEQRLAQLQIPDPSMYPEVRAKAVAELRQFMQDLRQAYVNVAQGATAAAATAAGDGWSVTEVK